MNIEMSDWKGGFITKEYIKRIHIKIQEIEHNMGKGRTLNKESAELTLANTAYESGKIQGLNEALGIIETIET